MKWKHEYKNVKVRNNIDVNEKENDTCIYFTWHDGGEWYKRKKSKRKHGKRKCS